MAINPDLYWIADIRPQRLAIMPRPRAGEWLADEIQAYGRLGVSVIVSLLEAHEVDELGLREEPALCRQHGLQFISHPIADRGVPPAADATLRLSADLAAMLRGGAGIAIHCRAGIGRSSLLAACTLGELGIDASRAFQMIGVARRVAVPDTPAQSDWVARHARVTRQQAQ